jgi:2-C-methyl-D-erythritol 4-phosphate cytidylyltransferase/2-C-methyl-D-erythritol 2,4-cyclodiphosphate synthase
MQAVSPKASADIVGVVVAGGASSRLGGPVPKQYLPLAGATVLERAVAALLGHPLVRGVVVVLPEEDLDGPRDREVRSLPGVLEVVAGGETRAASCRNGIRATGPAGYVLVHDAARPMVPVDVVDRVVRAALEHGAAVPVVPLTDTVKLGGAGSFVVRTLDRTGLFAAQTPQGARGDWLLEALLRAEKAGLNPTDEAAALEAAGKRIRMVEGDRENVKITTAADLAEARRKMESGGSTLRIGNGFDVHRFGEGRRLVLGGVEFPGEKGLQGHSDADVVLHAAMDALLGAAALGDIGAWFPPGDDAYAGANSAGLARKVASGLRDRGYEVVNLDLTVLAEAPRIRERVEEMRRSIAACLGIGIERIGLKATTLEGIGALGRGEGIACQATALISAAKVVS